VKLLVALVCFLMSCQLALADTVAPSRQLQHRWAQGAMEDYLAPLLSRRAGGSGHVKVLKCSRLHCTVRVTGTVRCRVRVAFRPDQDDPALADVWVERMHCR
jgi:hypothetical protein